LVAAGYTEDTLLRIEEIKTEYKRTSVLFLDPKEIINRAKEMKNKKLQNEQNTFSLNLMSERCG
jgi:hypothetical protein